MMLPVVALAAFVAGAWLLERISRIIQRRQYAARHGCEPPPHFKQESILGVRMLKESYTSLTEGRYLELTAERFAQYGDTFAFDQLGAPGILTIDPENVKAVLSTKFADFGMGERRASAFEPLIGHGIFTADGPLWERARRLVRPCFAHEQLEDVSLFEPHVQNMLARIPADGVSFDMQELFKGLTMDLATDFLFGESTSVLQPQSSAAGRQFTAAFDHAQTTVVKFFALGRHLAWAVRDSLWRHDQAVVHSFSTQYIDKALAREARPKVSQEGATSKYSFINELSRHTTDSALLRGGLLNVLLAGRDTTASLLTSLFFVLSRRPDIYQKLSAEVLLIVPDRKQPPTLQQLKAMPYLKACLNESLRMHPPIPRNSRTALRDTFLPRGGGPCGGAPVFVAKGTQVGYQAYSMHRRKDIFGADADDFVPERWSRKDMRPGWAYLAFSGGPRTCVGRNFALNQAMYIVARLLQEFESMNCDGDDAPWTEALGLTCSTRTGTQIAVKRRRNDLEGY
ncbi:hypothetical protein LTR85_007647 [Meristemomyces frigidus]|nr:hypothetical protein LTR85_007647 [Meristemomyces frigidus]